MSDTKVLRTWKGGPLRQMATTKVSAAFMPFAEEIEGCNFAGRYVCECCKGPCSGILLKDVRNDGRMSGKWHSAWLCDLCITGRERKSRTPEQKQANIARLAAARTSRRQMSVTAVL